MNPLPPQAYTKETLGKAYQWLTSQPTSIQELATNPDILVSLYLKAKLNGEGALERPSIQNFRSELKQLSQIMDEHKLAPDSIALQNEQQIAQDPRGQVSTTTSQLVVNQTVNQTLAKPAPSPGLQLDNRSLHTLREIKHELNFSSEGEALRVLIALGAKTLRK